MACSDYAADDDQIKAFELTGTYPPLSTAPVMSTPRSYVGSHSPSISANGNTDGILWVISGGNLYAFNASNLSQELYVSTQDPTRDTLPPVAHFATQIVANGKVYRCHPNHPFGLWALAESDVGRRRESDCSHTYDPPRTHSGASR